MCRTSPVAFGSATIAVVVASLSIAPPAVASGGGSVPGTLTVPGEPFRLARSGTNLSLSWERSCNSLDTDYAVYEGTIGSYYSHTRKLCSTHGLTEALIPLPDGDTYYLIVPLSADNEEGLYGVDGSLTPRPQGTPACAPQVVATPLCAQCPCWDVEELDLILPGFCRLTIGPTSTTFPCDPPMTDPRCNDNQCTSLETDCVNNFDSTPVSGFNTCANLNDPSCFTLEGSAGGAFSTNNSQTSTPSYLCGILIVTGNDLSDRGEIQRSELITADEALTCNEHLERRGAAGGWLCF